LKFELNVAIGGYIWLGQLIKQMETKFDKVTNIIRSTV